MRLIFSGKCSFGHILPEKMDTSDPKSVVFDVVGILVSGAILQVVRQVLQKRLFPRIVSARIDDEFKVFNCSRQAWKFTWHSCMCIFELIVILNSDFRSDIFRGDNALWNYDGGVLPPLSIRVLYIIQIGFFSVDYLYLVLVEKPDDMRTMQAHHLASLLLLWLSYSPNGTDIYLWKIGVAILFLHDIADVFISLSKTLHYAEFEVVSILCFVSTILVWILCRWIWFMSLFISAYKQPDLLDRWQMIPCAILLAVLYALHIMWGIAMIKVLVNNVVKGEKLQDKRDLHIER